MDDIVSTTMMWLPDLVSNDYVLFGHSMGGLIAFELAHALTTRGTPPSALVLSATPYRGPTDGRPGTRPMPWGVELRQRLAKLGGTPPEVLANDQIMEFLAPVIASDFAVVDGYVNKRRPPLTCPLAIVTGDKDGACAFEHVQDWRHETTGPVEFTSLSGGHFFIRDRPEEVLAVVEAFLTRHLK